MSEWSTPDELVRVSIDERIATITLDDAPRRNGLSLAMGLAVRSAVEHVNDSTDVSVAILTGAGPVFSAGDDVDRVTDRGCAREPLGVGAQSLGKLVMPSIAAVNGPVAGAGVNLATACDLIVAARSAVFDSRFLDVGIHPDGGHLWRISRLVGRQATAAMAIFGEGLTAEQAHSIGLVWNVVDDDLLTEESRRLARRVTTRPDALTRRTKATLIASLPITTERMAVDLERVQQEWSADERVCHVVTQDPLSRRRSRA